MAQETIIALATAPGTGAIATIRISGSNAIAVVSSSFVPKSGKKIEKQKGYTIHLGHVMKNESVLDEVLISLFRSPNSYTGEDVVEISCHGSPYIQQQLIQLFLNKGCRMATPGEFTLRAFLNGKMDLSQAEAVADLIASTSEASHQVALQQMRGGFKNEILHLREELLNFASLMELELDFSQEDVEFADRKQFNSLLNRISKVLEHLIDSFALGNVMKNGIPVAIIGEPNVGKSTLLNALLNEERAIVSEIAGTTRDTVEDVMSIGGINFRFIDTAGIRETKDTVEKIGIERSYEKVSEATLILHVVDAKQMDGTNIKEIRKRFTDKRFLTVVNKIDALEGQKTGALSKWGEACAISAKKGTGITALKDRLFELANTGALGNNDIIVSNNRHYDSLLKALEAIQRIKEGMEIELATDLLAIDLRDALNHLGEITGSVTNDELLGNIFSNFCIGK